MTAAHPPLDLSPPAIKLARRLQALPNDRIYAIIIVKREDRWELSISDEDGGKIEIAE